MKPFPVILSIALIASGCSTLPDEIKPERLARPSKIEVVHVKTIMVAKGMYGLTEGDYTSEMIDDLGTYYKGAGNCFKVHAGWYPGGIYITNNDPKTYRFYYYRIPNPTAAAKLDSMNVQSIANTAAPNAGIGTSALGGALAMGLMGAVLKLDDGKVFLLQPFKEVKYENLVSKPAKQ